MHFLKNIQVNSSIGIEWHKARLHLDLYLCWLPFNWSRAYILPIYWNNSIPLTCYTNYFTDYPQIVLLALYLITGCQPNMFDTPMGNITYFLNTTNSSPIYVFTESALPFKMLSLEIFVFHLLRKTYFNHESSCACLLCCSHKTWKKYPL